MSGKGREGDRTSMLNASNARCEGGSEVKKKMMMMRRRRMRMEKRRVRCVGGEQGPQGTDMT
jgi:hypothetical protein